MSSVIKKKFCLETFVDVKRISKRKIQLKNSDFKKGTFRIKSSGYYILTEDIIFDPDEKKLSSREYPIAPFGPYTLGFLQQLQLNAIM